MRHCKISEQPIDIIFNNTKNVSMEQIQSLCTIGHEHKLKAIISFRYKRFMKQITAYHNSGE